MFVFGDNVWRKEKAWPLQRATPTKWYVTSGGHANTSAGDGVLDMLPPRGAAVDTFTYHPADPTPFLIDSRELETSLNEDFTALNASRRDALVFTSKALTTPVEVTGPLSATLYAATDAKDTDWNVMRARFRKGFDKVVPLMPNAVERYHLDLWFTSRVFMPGHTLRVWISSALFPKYDRNLNTGGDNERGRYLNVWKPVNGS